MSTGRPLRFDIPARSGQDFHPVRTFLKTTLQLLAFVVLFQTPRLYAQDKAAVADWKKNCKKAETALETDNFTLAKACYEAALSAAGKFPTNDARLSETLTKLAKVRMNLGENAGAEIDLRRSLSMDESRLGAKDLRLFPTLLAIGECCCYAHRCDEADEFFLGSSLFSVE